MSFLFSKEQGLLRRWDETAGSQTKKPQKTLSVEELNRNILRWGNWTSSPMSQGLVFREMRSNVFFVLFCSFVFYCSTRCFTALLCWWFGMEGKIVLCHDKAQLVSFLPKHIKVNSFQNRPRQWVNYDVKFIYKNITFIWNIYKVN